MYTQAELKKQRAAILAGTETLLDAADRESRPLSDSEQIDFDNGCRRVEALNEQIENGNRTPTFSADSRGQPSGIIDNTPVEPLGARSRIAMPYMGANTPVLMAFGDTRRESEKAAYASGQWLRAQIYGSERAQRWCSDHGYKVYGMQSEGINTLGGNLVPTELEAAIIKLLNEVGVARRECRVRPMGSDHKEVPKRAGGLVAYFTNEGVAGTLSDSSWSLVGLTAKRLTVLSKMTSELAEDSVLDLALDFAEEIAYAMATKEDDCLMNGTASASYGGIQGIRETLLLDSRKGAVLAGSNVDTFAEVTTGDLNNMMATLPPYAVKNAKWYVSRAAYVLVFQRLIEAAGGITASDLVAGPIRRGYMGYPIIESEALPTTTGDLSGKIMLLFGDMRSGVEFGSRRGLRVALSEHVHFQEDMIGIKGTERFDINFHDSGDSTTAGAVIGLLGN